MDLPEATQEPIIAVDATPNYEYPLRILRAYRVNCDVRWVQAAGKPSILIQVMNEACDKRAAILDKAIAILERYLVESEE